MEVEQKPPDLTDWGLNNPFPLVWREFVREYRSDFTTLPDPRVGILEQDEALAADVDTIAALFFYHYRRLKPSALGNGADEPPPAFDIYA